MRRPEAVEIAAALGLVLVGGGVGMTAGLAVAMVAVGAILLVLAWNGARR